MSVIKAAEGITEITEQFRLEGTVLTLKVDKTLGELILSADIDFKREPKNYEYEDIEAFILGYLSNIRYDIPFLDSNASYYFNCDGKKFTLEKNTFKSNFINEMVSKKTITYFNEQYLRNALKSSEDESKKQGINKV